MINPELGNPLVAKAVIDELGVEFLAKESGRSTPTVYRWRREGFPRFFEMALRKKMPRLASWLAEQETRK